VQITRRSPFTGVTRTREINITLEQLRVYEMGAMVQEAFPHLSQDDREFIKTGISEEEWEGLDND